MTLEEMRAQMSRVGLLLRELRPGFDRTILWIMPLTLRALHRGEEPSPEGRLSAPIDEFESWLRAFIYYLLAIAKLPDVDPRAVDDADWVLAHAGTTRAALLSDGQLDALAQRRIEQLVTRLVDECPLVPSPPSFDEGADMDALAYRGARRRPRGRARRSGLTRRKREG